MSFKSKIKDLLISIYALPINLLAKKNPAYINIVINNILKAIEKRNNEFLSLYRRPKFSEKVISQERISDINKETVIILQGQLVKEENFTLETVRTFAKLYPGSKVIVSTWENEDTVILQQLSQERNCIVLVNKYPAYSGLTNLNYQVVTTQKGLEKAKELGFKYALKTRCDYRFYKKGLLIFLYRLLKSYAPDANVKYQKYRIVAGGERRNSMFRPFWIADQFMYGQIDDMLQYWNYTLLEKNITRKELIDTINLNHMTWNERTAKGYAVEPSIVIDYIRRMENRTPELTVNEYWSVINKQFILISREELEYYWFKYQNRFDESESIGNYYTDDSERKCLTYNWNFSTWLALYYGDLQYDEKYEMFANENRY